MSLLSVVRDSAASEVDRVKRQVRAAVRAAVLLLVAAVVLMVSLVFVMLGAYESMAEELPRWQAGALVGLGAVVFCLLLLALAKLGGGRRASRSSRRAAQARAEAASSSRSEDIQAAVELGAAASAAAGGAARDFMRRHRPSALDLAVSAFVVGLVASRATRPKPPAEHTSE
ncbi:MAG: hypothetical protein ACNA7W_18065 [Pseudomonadales bacterium]